MASDRRIDFSDIDTGLLRFCLQHGRVDGPTVIPDRDPNDYRWLREAFDSLEGDVQHMIKDVCTVQSFLSGSTVNMSEVEEALSSIQYYVEDIDNANDLEKINGIPPVVAVTTHANVSPAARSNALWVIATVAGNNPKGQASLLGHGALDATVTLLNNPDILRVKALSAVSAIVRDNLIGATRLLSLDPHLATLTTLVSDPDSGVQMRALLVLKHVLRLLPTLAESVGTIEFIHKISQCLAIINPDVRDRACELLLSMEPILRRLPRNEKTSLNNEIIKALAGMSPDEDKTQLNQLQALVMH
ncbi:hsp70-interacting protein [Pelomyxa schiedti]|nr:hsp70-interacting protein [Pelomyxa schiedti]